MAAVNNSSIFQPCVNFTQQCKVETLNLFGKLPPKGKEESRLANIARRIIFVCTVILPIIGLIAIIASECCGRPTAKSTTTTPPATQSKPKPPAPRPPVNQAAAPAAAAPQAGITVGQLNEILICLQTISPEDLVGNAELIENYKRLKAPLAGVDVDKFNKEDQRLKYIACMDIIQGIDPILGL